MTISELIQLSLTDLEKLFADTLKFYSDSKLIVKAYLFAKKHHRGQLRHATGKPYIVHPLRIYLRLFNEFKIRDDDYLISAFLHDVIEDTDVKYEEIETKFGKKAAKITKKMTRTRQKKETPTQKNLSKKKKNTLYLKSPYLLRLLKVIDILDSMNSWIFIKPTDLFYKKIPRWLDENSKINIPLAKTVDKKLVEEMERIKEKMNNRNIVAKHKNFIL